LNRDRAWAACAQRYANLAEVRTAALRFSLDLHGAGLDMMRVPDFDSPHEEASALTFANEHDECAHWEARGALYEEARARIAAQLAVRREQLLGLTTALDPRPRPVPWTYQVVESLAGFWVCTRWCLLMLFPPLGYLAMRAGVALVDLVGGTRLLWAMLLPLLAVPGYALWRGVDRIVLLGRVLTADVVSRTYANLGGGNVHFYAVYTHGWDVRVRSYFGPRRETRVTYTAAGSATHQLTVRGLTHYQGHVLVEPNEPARAYPLTYFVCCPRPNALGSWKPAVPWHAWLSTALGVALYLGAVVAWVLAWANYA
jgi:hypothetical protein